MPVEPDALVGHDEVDRWRISHPHWTVVDGRLHRALVFADFTAAFAFMGRVAEAAEALDHHPDWSNSWNRVTIDVVSHARGGITGRCLSLAERIDAAVDGPVS